VPQAERLPKHQTAIIFDWDDTLLYTSFLHQCQDRSVPPSTKKQLQSIERCTRELLEAALELGQTFIITNAMKGWVEDSCSKYMPSVAPVLQRVQIISARSAHESESRDISEWKRRAFLQLQKLLEAQVVTNLISIGDSQFELMAVNDLGEQFANCIVKTIKLQECPTPQELMKELELLVPKFKAIVQKAGNMKVRLEKR